MTPQPGVRERLQQQYGLKVLRVYLDGSSGATQVVFRLSDGRGEDDPDAPAALLTAPLRDLGLPEDSDADAEGDLDLPDERFRLPDHVASTIREFLRGTDPPDASLWIRFSRPCGLLPAMPWERLLQPVIRVPVLRLPHHMICPRRPQKELDAVICFSSPVSKPELHLELVDQFIQHIPPDLARYTRLHLFADGALYDQLRELTHQKNDAFSIEVYAPETQRRSRGNPWLSWIRRALDGRSADVVHFLCHCWRIRDQGALALAESPVRNTDMETAAMLFAPDLVEFLNVTGAWSVGFTSPPSNVSAVGMRMLQDEIARLRPGPVLLHDMKHPDSRSALAAAYRFLYIEDQPAPNSPAIGIYTHPVRGVSTQQDETSERLLNEYTLAGALSEQLTRPDAPSWLLASQRILEATAGNIAASTEDAADSGKKRARDFVLRALESYANESDSGKRK